MDDRLSVPEDARDDGFGARLLIDLGALADNWRTMRYLSAPARCAAVIKADGYGLGTEEVAETLYLAGCRDFFVATAREGVVTRQKAPEARIFVMNCILPGIEAACRVADLVPVLASMEHVALWTRGCIDSGDHPCALQVDTGMHRLGISFEEALLLGNDVTRPAGFSPVLVMSHLACADEADHPLNKAQRDRFAEIAGVFNGVEASLANSAGVLLGDRYLFDLTRPGISLYGGQATAAGSNDFRPVVTAESRIITIREARAGETVGYGAAATLTRDSRLAVCSIGYADGYMRALSGSGVPLRASGSGGACGYACGRMIPVIGRVTMDLTVFDVTDLPRGALRSGDFIELFGANLPLQHVADTAGTIGYEILTSLGARFRRRYLHDTATGAD